MKKLEYQVKFATPAFLGNAEQSGQWRTPPFKALLRQWWRVAYAADRGFQVNIADMRREEGRLFGVAADEREGSFKSQVRIRLDHWNTGKQRDWTGFDSQRVAHREVKNREGRLVPVGAQLYLGYGPLRFSNGHTALKANAAIQSGEQTTLRLAFPNEREKTIGTALQLMHCYGTVGGRSRNGWGSFSLVPADDGTPALDPTLDPNLLRPWRDALDLDWPHAIGRDEHALVWHINDITADWKPTMRRLAEIKIGLRTQFLFHTGRNARSPEGRHWLSYPVTNHSVSPWGSNARLPNSLRFKIRPEPDGGLRAVIFHVPCLPPAQFRPDRHAIENVWQRVHAYLDDPAQQLSRIPA